MKYFESFPSISYTFDSNNLNIQAVTNIFARNSFLRDIKDNVEVSYEYLIKDSDTPEIIAHKEYGDAYRSWIVLLFNNIINPNYDWPLKRESLEEYIEAKYNQTIAQAQETIHHYEKVITKTQSFQGSILDKTVETTLAGEYDVDYNTNKITPAVLPVVPDTSITVSDETTVYPTYTLNILTEVKAVSNYQNEVDQNELKRKIRILDVQYVQAVENQFKELMRNG